MSSVFHSPPKLQPGDRVAILSPSAGLPGVFPAVYEHGLQRLRDIFHLVPVEYATTRKMGSSPQARAEDIHAAFADPDIKAIISSIGGDDQIKVLKYLDPALLQAHPKAFFGYSDNTNLHIFLWNQGLVSYHGGSIMVHFGRGGSMHPYTIESLHKALFEQGTFELTAPSNFTDEYRDWGDPANLQREPIMYPNSGWRWHNGGKIVEGTTWGGNIEIISWNLSVNHYIQSVENYAGKILYLESSEEMPSAREVYRILMCMGERGLLQQFSALLVGRPQAWTIEQPSTLEQKERFLREQEEAVLKALKEYNPDIPAVFSLDFGHTDPQFIIPNGGTIKIDGVKQRVYITY